MRNSFLHEDYIGYAPPVERNLSWDADALFPTKRAKMGIIGICVQCIKRPFLENPITLEILLFADVIRLLTTELIDL